MKNDRSVNCSFLTVVDAFATDFIAFYRVLILRFPISLIVLLNRLLAPDILLQSALFASLIRKQVNSSWEWIRTLPVMPILCEGFVAYGSKRSRRKLAAKISKRG